MGWELGLALRLSRSPLKRDWKWDIWDQNMKGWIAGCLQETDRLNANRGRTVQSLFSWEDNTLVVNKYQLEQWGDGSYVYVRLKTHATDVSVSIEIPKESRRPYRR